MSHVCGATLHYRQQLNSRPVAVLGAILGQLNVDTGWVGGVPVPAQDAKRYHWRATGAVTVTVWASHNLTLPNAQDNPVLAGVVRQRQPQAVR